MFGWRQAEGQPLTAEDGGRGGGQKTREGWRAAGSSHARRPPRGPLSVLSPACVGSPPYKPLCGKGRARGLSITVMPVFVRWLLAQLPLNPIVVRLVQGGSRRIQHMYIRSAYLAVLIIVLLALLIQVQGGATEFRKLA